MLRKPTNTLENIVKKQHVEQLRQLLQMLQAIDTTACLVPVDEQAEDQTPLREIQQAPSIWKKELQPYINCKNCTFGSKYTQSLQI